MNIRRMAEKEEKEEANNKRLKEAEGMMRRWRRRKTRTMKMRKGGRKDGGIGAKGGKEKIRRQ